MSSRKRSEEDFRREIDCHIRLEADRLKAEGLPVSEAESSARRAFGNVGIAQERFYESRHWVWLEQLSKDVLYGLRSLRKSPGFTVVVGLTVALGVAANTAVFSFVDAVILRSLPVQNPKELVFLEAAGSAGFSGPPPYPCFTMLRAETDVFSGAAAFASDELRVEIDGRAAQVMGQVASGTYFDVLGVKPTLGRLMNAEDEKLNSPVAVISYRYWRRRFGADPTAIGKSISFRGQPFTIIGVTASDFMGLQPGSPVDLTLPISIERELQADTRAFWLEGIVARLRPGISIAKAAANSDVVFRSYMSSSGGSAPDLRAKYWERLEAVPAAHGSDVLRRRFSRPLYTLMAVAVLVLMLAVANIVNLLLVRGFTRRGEFGVRLALGAGRLQIGRQILIETVLLFGVGAIPGVILARWCVSFIRTIFSDGRRPITLDPTLDWHILTFCLALTLLAALISGIIPVARAMRVDPEGAIKESESRISESQRTGRLTQALVAFQVALSFVLLVGAVAFVSTVLNLLRIDPGFRNQDVLTLSIQAPEKPVNPSKSAENWGDVLESVRLIPGVRAAALATLTPLSGRDRGGMVKVQGYDPPTFEDGIVHINQVSSGYFESLGIPLLSGRLLNDRDTGRTPKVAVINESAAREYFHGRNAIGQSLDFVRNEQHSVYQVVGIVGDTKHMNLREAAPRFAFIPIGQARDQEQRLTLVVAPDLSQGGLTLLRPVRREVLRLNPRFLISDVITMKNQLNSTLITERLLADLSASFGTLAVILASVGLYGALSYQIGQQQRVIGIRMALGAAPSSIRSTVFGQTMRVLSIGLLAGLPFAFWSARAAGAMLWGLNANDPWMYLGCAALICVIGSISGYLPARRASAIEPVLALRHL